MSVKSIMKYMISHLTQKPYMTQSPLTTINKVLLRPAAAAQFSERFVPRAADVVAVGGARTIATSPLHRTVSHLLSASTALEAYQSPQLRHVNAVRRFLSTSVGEDTTSTVPTVTTTGTLKESYEFIKVDATTHPGVGIITLHRPKALNALCDGLFADLIHAATALDQNYDTIGCIVLTGSTKAFAAGADISEMKDRTFDHAYTKNMFQEWANITKVSKPVIAAVNGFCLGGGCELAMMCDMIIASPTAKFGQPEINLGVIPGAGGTQRLTRAIGKSKAMYMCLTGEMMDAEWAERAGLVTKIVPSDELLNETIQIATKIASRGRISVMMAKEAVNASQELSLQEGLRFERRLFHSLFATADQKEGMSAFLEKRPPNFTNK